MISHAQSAFPKPSELEGKVTLSTGKRRKKLDELCAKQNMLCAISGKRMTRTQGLWNTATLDHRRVQPAGCKKDDRDSNLQAVCWKENFEKGSRR